MSNYENNYKKIRKKEVRPVSYSFYLFLDSFNYLYANLGSFYSLH